MEKESHHKLEGKLQFQQILRAFNNINYFYSPKKDFVWNILQFQVYFHYFESEKQKHKTTPVLKATVPIDPCIVQLQLMRVCCMGLQTLKVSLSIFAPRRHALELGVTCTEGATGTLPNAPFGPNASMRRKPSEDQALSHMIPAILAEVRQIILSQVLLPGFRNWNWC